MTTASTSPINSNQNIGDDYDFDLINRRFNNLLLLYSISLVLIVLLTIVAFVVSIVVFRRIREIRNQLNTYCNYLKMIFSQPYDISASSTTEDTTNLQELNRNSRTSAAAQSSYSLSSSSSSSSSLSSSIISMRKAADNGDVELALENNDLDPRTSDTNRYRAELFTIIETSTQNSDNENVGRMENERLEKLEKKNFSNEDQSTTSKIKAKSRIVNDNGHNLTTKSVKAKSNYKSSLHSTKKSSYKMENESSTTSSEPSFFRKTNDEHSFQLDHEIRLKKIKKINSSSEFSSNRRSFEMKTIDNNNTNSAKVSQSSSYNSCLTASSSSSSANNLNPSSSQTNDFLNCHSKLISKNKYLKKSLSVNSSIMYDNNNKQ